MQSSKKLRQSCKIVFILLWYFTQVWCLVAIYQKIEKIDPCNDNCNFNFKNLCIRTAISNIIFSFGTIVANKYGYSPHFCKIIS